MKLFLAALAMALTLSACPLIKDGELNEYAQLAINTIAWQCPTGAIVGDNWIESVKCALALAFSNRAAPLDFADNSDFYVREMIRITCLNYADTVNGLRGIGILFSVTCSGGQTLGSAAAVSTGGTLVFKEIE